jgi:hypothetical protein
VIAAETDKDVRTIVLDGRTVSRQDARESARRVADAIVNTKARSLEDHALGEIQTWRDSDEQKISVVRHVLVTTEDLPEGQQGSSRIFATHVVAAAVMEALTNGNDLPVVFDRMVSILNKMHGQNPVWGPLFVRHPGNIARDLAYVPHRQLMTQVA